MGFISNNIEEYSLLELFSNRKIIIPDFQRDYCWGDPTHGGKNDSNIVDGFLDSLFDEFTVSLDNIVLLGKIDVFEQSKDQIYLTDGQQRLTTLYLLIGILYRKTKNENLKKCLIFNYEGNHDKEPTLKYAIRESTIFFLKDLVNDFFINENNRLVADIKNSTWYFSEYDLDPTIISMLSALEIIEQRLNKISITDIKEFSKFVAENIIINYHKVEDKQTGEERFVIINTTGKSLTASENIKPLLLGGEENSNFAKQWEERETWFWKNRNTDEYIADHGVNEFLVWCFQIIVKQDEVDIVKKAKELLRKEERKDVLVKIHNYFESLKILVLLLEDEKILKQFNFIEGDTNVKGILGLRALNKLKKQNIVLPLLAFIKKISSNVIQVYQFLRRLRKNYFDQKWDERKDNYVDWRYILQIIERSSSLDAILQYDINLNSINRISGIEMHIWFNIEEKIKNQVLQHKPLLEEFEDHPDFMGDLSFMLQTASLSETEAEPAKLHFGLTINIDQFQRIYHNYESTIELIRESRTAEKNVALANMFRLFRLFIKCNKVDHIYRTSGSFEGVLFSTLNRKHLSKVEFMRLLNSHDLLEYCTSRVKQMIKEQNLFDLEYFSVDRFIKAWLTLKVFNANEKNALISFY